MTVEYKKVLGRISLFCYRKKMTMSELAVELNYPPDKFVKVKSGKAHLRFSDIIQICNYFEITPNELLI